MCSNVIHTVSFQRQTTSRNCVLPLHRRPFPAATGKPAIETTSHFTHQLLQEQKLTQILRSPRRQAGLDPGERLLPMSPDRTVGPCSTAFGTARPSGFSTEQRGGARSPAAPEQPGITGRPEGHPSRAWSNWPSTLTLGHYSMKQGKQGPVEIFTSEACFVPICQQNASPRTDNRGCGGQHS